MSLAAALKKGLETADTVGNWDPFADEGKAAPTGPANTNAAARALASKTAAKPVAAKRSPISAVRDGARSPLARMPAEEPAAPAARVQAAPAHSAPAHSAPARQPAGTAQQRIAARQAGQRPQAAPATAQKPAQRANWLHDAVPGGRVNAAQYVRELDRFAAEENRRAVSDVVMEVNQSEVEGVVRHAARIKGRYLAKLLDIGNKSKSGVMEAEVSELTRYRETYEELARGLDILKSAIESGDISVSGTVRR
ncbi:MAG: hypothetical protein P1U88_16185 [Thalassobaculaceae bacterium]|nr:hypothetical protein [Thalassobaculaceae bacterium]